MKEMAIKTGLTLLAVFAPIKAIMITVGVLIISDLILGTVAAKKRGEVITSAGFRRTVVKGFVYQSAIILGFLTEKYLLDGAMPVSKIVAGLIGLVELTSCLENLNAINGSPIFKKLIEKLGSQNDKDLK